MHPLTWACCTASQEPPWWTWLIVAGLIVIWIVIWAIWIRPNEGFGSTDERPDADNAQGEPAYADTWARAAGAHPPRLRRSVNVPHPQSAEEASLWAESEGFRRTQFIHAPVFWVVLPLAAIGFLIHQSITDPTGANVNITINGESVDSWPAWLVWLFWIAAGIWLLIAVGVLIVSLRIFADLRLDDAWANEHGVAYSIHRSSFDDDSEGGEGWHTYIALDNRLDDQQAERIYAALEQWLSTVGLPPSGSGPISSARLFGADAVGGYFFLRLPVSQAAGADTPYRWMLIAEPRNDDDEVIVIPVPVKKRMQKLRARLRARAARTPGRDVKGA